jgi:hypothetical protein
VTSSDSPYSASRYPARTAILARGQIFNRPRPQTWPAGAMWMRIGALMIGYTAVLPRFNRGRDCALCAALAWPPVFLAFRRFRAGLLWTA